MTATALRWVTLTVLVTACATVPSSISIPYRFQDAPERQTVEVSYRNTFRYAICLSPSQWPNVGGKINSAGGTVALVVDGQRFPLKDFNTGYCFGGCPIRVAPGEEVSGFLRYADFNLPHALVSRPKSLDFSPSAHPCSRSTM